MKCAYRSINPFSEEQLAETDAITDAELARQLDKTAASQQSWARLSAATRGAAVHSLVAALSACRDELAANLVCEVGKPISQALAEVDKCVELCIGYAELTETLLKPRPFLGAGANGYVELKPLGIVLGVMPWNYPYWQTLRFAVPNLLLGNACLIKPAPNASVSALGLSSVVAKSAIDPTLVNILLLDEDSVQRLLAEDRVCGVSVTGSVRAGAAVASSAGRNVKKTVLELGGSDPFIVLPDADVERAAKAAARSRLTNAGQSCVSAKRFIVERPVLEPFVEFMTQEFASARVGDLRDPATSVGPMARADLREELAAQVSDSIEQGATLHWAHSETPDSAFFYPPTILIDVPLTSRVWTEETFGPVAPVVGVDTQEEAVRLANESAFGLGASVWTSSRQRADAVGDAVSAGMVFVNDVVQSNWRLPFGGLRRSGFGRELAVEGLTEFANVKVRHWPRYRT